ncbi:MAG TPA: hypothetical protein VKB19_18940, partial [Pedobacter sp.]|nr:hypothetical protein [Pedobacter sp.]
MKKVMLALLIITAASYISCKKEGDTAGELYGKWKLTEQLSDPGDGSGKYQKVNGSPKYLTI